MLCFIKSEDAVAGHMPTTVAVYQPRYFPRLHYLARIRRADVFVVYDDVEFSRRSRQHRAPIEFQNRDWLTAPVKHNGGDSCINEAKLDMSTPWIKEHVETLLHKYGDVAEGLEQHYLDLLPFVPSLEAARTISDETRRNLPPAATDALETFARADSAVQAYARQRRDLEAKKQRVGEEIAGARSGGNGTKALQLVEGTKDLSERIEAISKPENQQTAIRNEALVTLGEYVEDVASVERMSIRSLWDLDGVDVPEIAGEPRLADLTIPLLKDLIEQFDIDTRVVRSSQLPVTHPGDPSAYLAKITKAVDGDCYLSGRAGYESYVDEACFEAEDVSIAIQDWEPDWPDGNVCSLDVLFTASDQSQHVR